MTTARRTLTALLAAAAFGVLAGMFKGDETGFRAGLGNLSAPWLLVAALPALRARSVGRGALLGLLSTGVALAGFYATLTVVLAGRLGGGGYPHELAVEVGANRIYFLAGLVTGPLCGAAGARLGRRHPDTVWLAVGSLVAGEIAGVALLQGHQLAPSPLYFVWGVGDWTPYVGESLVGVAIAGAALWRRSRRTGRRQGA